MQIDIRQATAEDAPLVADFANRLTEEIIERTGSTPVDIDREQTVDLCRKLLDSGRYRVWLAFDGESGGKPVGAANLCESCALYAGGTFGIIQEFYVLPAYRSQDVGAVLLRAVEEYGRQAGWRRLELCTPPLPEFGRTLAFYERNAYTVTGGRKLKRRIE